MFGVTVMRLTLRSWPPRKNFYLGMMYLSLNLRKTSISSAIIRLSVLAVVIDAAREAFAVLLC